MAVVLLSDEMAHHGIIGQKWGVLHGPPYPLDQSVSNRVSAGKRAPTKRSSGSDSDGGRRSSKPGSGGSSRKSSGSTGSKRSESSPKSSRKSSGSTEAKKSTTSKKASDASSKKPQDSTKSKRIDASKSKRTGEKDEKKQQRQLHKLKTERDRANADYDKAVDTKDDEGMVKAANRIGELTKKIRGIDLTDEQKTALKVAAVAAGSIIAAYTASRLYKYVRMPNTNRQMSNQLMNQAAFNLRAKKFSMMGDVEKLPKKDLVLEPGHVFQRLSVGGGDSYHVPDSHVDFTYMTTNERDAKRLLGIFPTFFGRLDDQGKFHQTRYTSNTEIRSPSAYLRYTTFVDMLRNNKDFNQALVDDGIIGYSFAPMLGGFKGKSTKANSFLDTYRIFCRKFGGRQASVAMYCDEIKGMGYNALIDDNDANRITDTPIILFNNSDYSETEDIYWTFDSDEYREAVSDLAPINVNWYPQTVLKHDSLDGDHLAHYGVLGMKWGVRHDRERQGLIDRRTSELLKKNPNARINGKDRRSISRDAKSYNKLLKGKNVGFFKRRSMVKDYRNRAEATTRYAYAEKQATKQIDREYRNARRSTLANDGNVSVGRAFATSALVVGTLTIPMWAPYAERGARVVAPLLKSAANAVGTAARAVAPVAESAARAGLDITKAGLDAVDATTKAAGAAYVSSQARRIQAMRDDVARLRNSR